MGANWPLEKCDKFILFFKSSWCNSPYSSIHPGANQLERNGIYKCCPPNSSDDLCPFFCIQPSSSEGSFVSGLQKCKASLRTIITYCYSTPHTKNLNSDKFHGVKVGKLFKHVSLDISNGELKGQCHEKSIAFYNMRCCFRPKQWSANCFNFVEIRIVRTLYF